MVTFLTAHLGYPIPSPALLEKIGNRFRREVKAFAAENEIPILTLKKPDRTRWDDRKLDHVRPYLEQAELTAVSGSWPSSPLKSSSGSSAPRSGQPSRAWSSSTSSRRSAGSGCTTSTFSIPSSGRASSRSVHISPIRPRSGATDTSGPSARPHGRASTSPRWPTASPPVRIRLPSRPSATASAQPISQGFFDRWTARHPYPFTDVDQDGRLLLGTVDAPGRGLSDPGL